MIGKLGVSELVVFFVIAGILLWVLRERVRRRD
jgi:hypothetical protein